MKAALKEITAARFHLFPFKQIWRLPSDHEVRCFDEVYTSDAFIEANDKLQKQANEPGYHLEKVILGLMFWSDSTHLASFGNSKVWPIISISQICPNTFERNQIQRPPTMLHIFHR
jgi:hypothetical protein